MINLVPRISRVTLQNPSAGVVDLSRYRGPGGFSTQQSRLGEPLIRQGEIEFESPEFDASPVELDPRENDLWCRGSVLKIYALDTRGVEHQLAELVLQKTVIKGFNASLRITRISCSFTCYLGENNARGKDIETVAESPATRRALVEAALTAESSRSLNINLTQMPEDELLGIFPLLADASPAQMGAKFGASPLVWLYVDNEGVIRDRGVTLSSEGKDSPALRINPRDCVRFDFVPASEDVVNAAAVASNVNERADNPLPATLIDESYARVSDIIQGSSAPNRVILATKVVTRINSRNEVTREVTKPLASWVSFSNTSNFDPSYLPLLLTYYTVVYEDGLRVHDFDFRLISQSGLKSGIAGAFRQNFSATVEDALDNPAAILDTVQLKTSKTITHVDGIPVLQRGSEEVLSDNYLNAGVTPEDATQQKSAVKWQEQQLKWGRNMYRPRRHNSAPNRQSESSLGRVSGPPSPDFLVESNEFEPVLIEDTYDTDISSVNCGQTKQVTLQIEYGVEAELVRVGQWEVERRVSAQRAVRVAIPLPDFFLKSYRPFRRVDIGRFSYKVEAPSVAWDANGMLAFVFVGHETGRLATEIPYEGTESPAWPQSATRVIEAIISGTTCDVPTPGPVFPGTLQMRSQRDRNFVIGEEIGPIRLQAIGGAMPYTYDDSLGALPDGLSIDGSYIVGTPTALGTFPVTIRATDSTSGTPQTAQTSFTYTTIEVPATTFPVPVTLRVKGGLGLGGFMQLLEYPLIQSSQSADGGLAVGGQMELLPQSVLVPGLPVEAGVAMGGQMVLGTPTDPTSASGAIALSGRMVLGATEVLTSEGAIALSGQMVLVVVQPPLPMQGGIALAGAQEVSLNSFEFNDGSNFEFNDGANFEFNE